MHKVLAYNRSPVNVHFLVERFIDKKGNFQDGPMGWLVFTNLKMNPNFLAVNIFRTMVLKKTLESPLDSKEIKPVNPKGNQPWIFIGRTEAEAPILWPPDVKCLLIGKDPDAGKDWGQEEKGVTEDEMVGWHHWLKGHELERTPGDNEGEGSLACCSPWGG